MSAAKSRADEEGGDYRRRWFFPLVRRIKPIVVWLWLLGHTSDDRPVIYDAMRKRRLFGRPFGRRRTFDVFRFRTMRTTRGRNLRQYLDATRDASRQARYLVHMQEHVRPLSGLTDEEAQRYLAHQKEMERIRTQRDGIASMTGLYVPFLKRRIRFRFW